jgi:lipid A disaccharide synthetase
MTAIHDLRIYRSEGSDTTWIGFRILDKSDLDQALKRIRRAERWRFKRPSFRITEGERPYEYSVLMNLDHARARTLVLLSELDEQGIIRLDPQMWP